jgi:hypothetical protein
MSEDGAASAVAHHGRPFFGGRDNLVMSRLVNCEAMDVWTMATGGFDTNGQIMRFTLKPLSAGAYNVKMAGEINRYTQSEGRFSFRV